MRQKRATELAGELIALQEFFAYNTFVRKKYLSFITKLPKKILTKNREASFPSILDIQTHILDVYRCWFHAYETGEACERWMHRYETGKDELSDLIGLSLTQIRRIEKQVDNHVESAMKNMTVEDLSKSFQYTLGSGSRKKILIRSVREMLYHLIEEELQHRGELNALLWQDDIAPPVTSWFEWKKKTDVPG